MAHGCALIGMPGVERVEFLPCPECWDGRGATVRIPQYEPLKPTYHPDSELVVKMPDFKVREFRRETVSYTAELGIRGEAPAWSEIRR